MLKFILLGIVACLISIFGAFTTRNDNSKLKRRLWWLGLLLSLCLTCWGVYDSFESEKQRTLESHISLLAHDAVSSLRSRTAFLEMEALSDSFTETNARKSNSLLKHLKQARERVHNFYWSFRHNQDAYTYELKFHLQVQPKRLTAEQIHWYFQSEHNTLQKRIHAKYVADRKLTYFVEDLVHLALNDPNLKVASSAVTALESLVNHRFSSTPPYNDVLVWWEKKGSKINEFRHPFDEYSTAYKQFRMHWQNDRLRNEALGKMRNIVDGRSGFGTCLAFLAVSELDNNDRIAALNYYKRLWSECDGFLYDKLIYISILSDSNPLQAQRFLNKLAGQFQEDELSYEMARNSSLQTAIDKRKLSSPVRKQEKKM